MTINDRIGKYLASGRSWYTRDVKTITKFSVHHDAIPHDQRTADQVMQSIFGIHNGKNGWPGMSYHYYIHRDGTVYQVNKHEWVTWIDGINWDAIGIVMNGYFHPSINDKPTEAQLKALKELLDELCTKHPEFPASQKDVYAHRERGSTSCNGDLAYPYVKEYRDKLGQVSWGGAITPPPPPTSPLPEPNPGYAPTFEGQTVSKDGKTYKSYKDASGKLLWKIEPHEDWKKKYEEEVEKNKDLQSKIDKAKADLA